MTFLGLDLKFAASICDPARDSLAGDIDELGPAGIRTDHAAFAADNVPALRGALRWEHKVKTFSCLDQYLCMAFAQLNYREKSWEGSEQQVSTGVDRGSEQRVRAERDHRDDVSARLSSPDD